MDLHGKTVILTGGRRVGLVVAERLAAAGMRVALTYRESRREMEEAAKQLAGKHGVRVAAFALDVADERSIRAFLTEVERSFGPADALVNMASVFTPDPKTVQLGDMEQAFRIPLGSMLLSRRFAEEAKERQAKNAPIVSFVDWAVDHPYAGYDLYLAGKAALRHYLMALQVTFAGTVRVVNIHPGMIQEPPGFSPAEKREIVANTPTKAIGDARQAAVLVQTALELDFLADNIALDGGQHWRHRL